MTRRPKLGQHFLTSTSARQHIVDALGDVSHCTVVEIGPGHGALTDLLAPRAQHLVAIDLDRDLAPALAARYAGAGNVQVLHADILTVKLADLHRSGEEMVIIGNLPYYITSDILLWLFAQTGDFSRAVLMMQEEVAGRVTAHPGGSEYGLLSATTQLYARAEKLFSLPPGAFSPPPKVHSAVVRLHPAPRCAELGVEGAPFLVFLRTCFQQKRKTLANNLRAVGHPPAAITAAMQAALLGPALRAEAVPLEALAQLFRSLAPMDTLKIL
ncbi:MAG: 16S rRNA (adenine(1518)-N(6)/adenine(1519)-N(6))-dimethyltransferase RsmA [Acidobacteriaceae bacterium]